jgi:hypothetical protein
MELLILKEELFCIGYSRRLRAVGPARDSSFYGLPWLRFLSTTAGPP